MSWPRFQISLAKKLDSLLGHLLSLWVQPRNRPAPAAPEAAQRILFIKFWGLGSIILSEPALRVLKQRYPSARLDYLTLDQNREVFDLIPQVDRVHTLPHLDPLRFLVFAAAMVLKLRRQRYDLVLDAEFFVNCSAVLARLIEPGFLVGFGSGGRPRGRLMDCVVPFTEQHTAGLFVQLARWEGEEAPVPKPSVTVPDSSQVGGTPREFIVVNINASPLAFERRWPSSCFLRLCKGLLERYTFSLVLTGGSSEVGYVGNFARELDRPDRVLNLAGRLSLVQLAQVIEASLALLSNDSGPVHLASALDVPVIALYGPETPDRYGPLSSRKLVLYKRLWCSPCMSLDNSKTVECVNHLACLRQLSVEEVFEQTVEFIDFTVLPDSERLRREIPS